MIVVSDTTPIHYLILIDEIEIVSKLLGEVIIPDTVFRELNHAETPEKIKKYLEPLPRWLSVRKAPQIIDEDLSDLDPGERAAILLSEELSADGIIIDELAGRKAAVARGLRVIGTLGILEIAAQRGLLDFHTTLDRIKTEGFYISSRLETELRSKNG